MLKMERDGKVLYDVGGNTPIPYVRVGDTISFDPIGKTEMVEGLVVKEENEIKVIGLEVVDIKDLHAIEVIRSHKELKAGTVLPMHSIKVVEV